MRKQRFIIDVEYGSEYQEEIWAKILPKVLIVIWQWVEERHKKSKFKIEEVFNPINK